MAGNKKKKKQSGGDEWEKIVPPPGKHTVPASSKMKKKSKKKNKDDTKAKSKSKQETSSKSKKDTKNTDAKKSKDKQNKQKKQNKNVSNTVEKPKTKAGKKKIKVGHKTVEIERPPKTLLLIWILVAAELCLDLVTTGIAFSAFLSEPGTCCETQINNGAGPLGATIPFFFLVIAELIFLLRSIMLTLFPTWMTNQSQEVDVETGNTKTGRCNCGSWAPKFIMWIVNFLTIINPFFGFAIAWMLMYQSDKAEALTVMGLEAATIILHFASVYLEKAAETWKLKLMHSLIIIPWLATVGINVWYINRGGVCYDTNLETFWYKGCEVCPNGLRPVNGTICATTSLVDGQNVTTYQSFQLWDLDSATDCDAENQVCWFPY